MVMNWQLSSYFGWGIYGINVMLHWSRRHHSPLLTAVSIDESLVDLNPMEWAMIRPAIAASRVMQDQFKPFAGQFVKIDRALLQPFGDDVYSTSVAAHGVELFGNPHVGITFFEQTLFTDAGRERAKAYPLIVAGSSWNKAVLEGHGIGPVALVLQGVDPTVFHPAPSAGWFGERFTIFSGGKLEYRKGQDLVIKAFRIFAERHSEALLIAAWASPWPGIAHSLDTDPTLKPITFLADGRLDVTAWLLANGLRGDQFIDLGAIPNGSLPRLYREMDVALFPNRCEGGTNLVAMECMACGVPVILSHNTGHLDLIDSERSFILEQQAPIAGANVVGWGESSIEEIVETLETVYRDRSASLARAARGADFMSSLTWAATVDRLTEALTPYCF